MVKVTEFHDETEAQLACDYLRARDISAHVVGAKEYTAHLLGGGAGHFELMVEPIHLLAARDLLASLPTPERSEPLPPNHFRRGVLYALLAAFLLPLVFNYASLIQVRELWRTSDRGAITKVKVAFILLLQLLPVATVGAFWITRPK